MTPRQLFDQGATNKEVAAEHEISYSTAVYICRPLAPTWPTFSPEQLDAIPHQIRRMIEATNPNHKEQNA